MLRRRAPDQLWSYRFLSRTRERNRVAMEPDLVGGIPTPLKNMKVSWEYYYQYMDK